MAVLTAPAAPFTPSLPQTAGPSCSLQRSGSLWQLGIEAQSSPPPSVSSPSSWKPMTTTAAPSPRRAGGCPTGGREQQAGPRRQGRCHLLGDRAPARPGRLPPAAGQASERSGPLRCRPGRCAGGLAGPGPHSAAAQRHPLLVPESRADLPQVPGGIEIEDEESLPPEWLALKTTSQPDKAAIKEALKAGHLIPGAQLISRRSWRIH